LKTLLATALLGLLGTALFGGAGQAAGGGVKIFCLNSKGTDYKPRTAPSTCVHYCPGGAFGGGVNLEQLVWTNFGSATATATAIECGFHLPCSNIPVQVTAFRLKKVCGKRVYTRLSATSSFGTTTVKLFRCEK
jgi:hypothetical protein